MALPTCLSPQGPHPVPSRRPGRSHGELGPLLQEEPGLPASPWGFSRGGVRAWPPWCRPPALLGHPLLRKCIRPGESLGQEAAADSSMWKDSPQGLPPVPLVRKAGQ